MNTDNQVKPYEPTLEDYWQARDYPQPSANNLPANFDGFGVAPARRDVPISTVDYTKLAKGVGLLAGGSALVAVGVSAVKAMALAVYVTIMANPGTTTLVFLGGTFVLWLSACRSGGDEPRNAAGGGQYTNNVTVNIINRNQQQ